MTIAAAVLVDTTKCIGCRSCQVSCKQWNKLPGETTEIEGRSTGYQNPPSLSSKTHTMVTFREVEDARAPGGLRWVFAKRQCMHCKSPACASACPVTALTKTAEGPVTYDKTKCLGCRYCVWACPFGVPTAEWESRSPIIHKCTMCFNRITQPATADTLNGQPLSPELQKNFLAGSVMPACVKACPTGALKFGDRDELLAEGWKRIKTASMKYVHHIFGENEAGGTSYLYLSAVPFEKHGFRTDLGERSYAYNSNIAMRVVSPAMMVLGGLLTGVYMLKNRKAEIAANTEAGKKE